MQINILLCKNYFVVNTPIYNIGKEEERTLTKFCTEKRSVEIYKEKQTQRDYKLGRYTHGKKHQANKFGMCKGNKTQWVTYIWLITSNIYINLRDISQDYVL
jgi:hypothetical protein